MTRLVSFVSSAVLVVTPVTFAVNVLGETPHKAPQPAASITSPKGSVSEADRAFQEKLKKLPKSGVLASSTNVGFASKGLEGRWGTDEGKGSQYGDKGGEEGAPLSGSVQKISAKEWKATVSNTDKKHSFSASVRVDQTDTTGHKLKSDYFSVSLAPGASSDRTISADSSTAGMTLALEHWKLSGGK